MAPAASLLVKSDVLRGRKYVIVLSHMQAPKKDDLAPVWRALANPVRREILDLLSEEPLAKWKATISNPLRKRWCRRYLDWLGRERLAAMGYDLDGLQRELNSTKGGLRHLGGDLLRISTGAPYTRLKESIFQGRHARLQKRVMRRDG